MKRRLILSLCLLGLCLGAEAQEGRRGYQTTFEANPFWHNWFVSANFGANSLVAENLSVTDFRHSITFMPVLSVGKWFNPWWGVRVQGGGGSLHGFTPRNEMLHHHYMYAHADFMLGLINFFGKYKADRKFDLVPFAGIGGMTRSKDQSFIIDAGIQARYALSERFDVNVEFTGMILDDDLVTRGGFPNDGIAGLTAGVTYRFKNREFRVAPSKAELAALEAENKRLEGKVKDLENRKPEVKVLEREVVKEVLNTEGAYKGLSFMVPFGTGKSDVRAENEAGLVNLAQFLNEHKELRVTVTGYADQSGSEEVNLRISRARAENVAKLLTEKYGVTSDRIVVKYVGKENPFYEVDGWNRCVIVTLVQ